MADEKKISQLPDLVTPGDNDYIPAVQGGGTFKVLMVAISNYVKSKLPDSTKALGAVTPAANKLFYFTSATAGALVDLSAYVRDLLSSTDAATFRTGLGLGSVSTENTVPVNKGGTGSTTSSSARAALGVGQGGAVRFSATKTAAQSIVGTSTATLVSLPVENIDVGSGFDIATGRFTAPQAGDYLFSFQVSVVNAATADLLSAQLWVNGVRHTSSPLSQSSSTGVALSSGSTTLVTLAAGGYVELYAVLAAAAARNTATASYSSFMNGTLLY